MTWLRKFLRRDDGASTIEFVILFPAFMIVFISTIDAGILMLRTVLLERGVDLAVRELRLGINPPADEDEMKVSICNHASFLRDCTNNLRVELTRVEDGVWAFPNGGTQCVERTEEVQPALQFVNGTDHDIMVLRACAVYSPMFPTTGLGLRMVPSEGDTYSLVSTSAFVVEPT